MTAKEWDLVSETQIKWEKIANSQQKSKKLLWSFKCSLLWSLRELSLFSLNKHYWLSSSRSTGFRATAITTAAERVCFIITHTPLWVFNRLQHPPFSTPFKWWVALPVWGTFIQNKCKECLQIIGLLYTVKNSNDNMKN